MKINENWNGSYVNTKLFNFGVKPLKLKTRVSQEEVTTTKLSKKELHNYLEKLKYKEIKRIKGE